MRSLILILAITFPFLAVADVQYAGGIGVLANENDINADTDGSMREEIAFGWYAGSRILYPLKDSWALRTGIGFQEKSAQYAFKVNNSEGDLRLSVISLTVPVIAQWKLHQKVSPFAGYTADFGLSDDCEDDGNSNDCSIYGDKKSLVNYAVIGASVHLEPEWDLDISYHRALSDSFTDVKIHSLALQIFYNF